ncbi:hypothetical protein J4H91_02410 [Leucobacter ruminantium]|uniref:SURF1-like protein n=2 Tax=Leucobacter ruminantium TaxID=1289170 RepID=A0A939RXT1_9MICO|nr:hypothetical protein [Leucobacter ruminantium]
MLRPQWILALLLALIVAAVFAWLGRWQMDNAIRTDAHETSQFETPRPLSDLAEPGAPVTEAAAGAVVTVPGAFRADDLRVVAPRDNAGERGAWVVAHLVTPASDDGEGSHLAVAVGWAPDEGAAERVVAQLSSDPEFTGERELEGRFMPSEGPTVPEPGQDPSLLESMVPAQLVNLWNGVDGPAYAGYLVMHPTGDASELLDTAGLDPIDSVAPEAPESVNWLNVFYAIEWIVFAGFAVFLWFRLARDAWEKEHELQLLEAADGVDSSV